MIAGCYVLHLYCDGPCRGTPYWERTCCGKGPAEYTGRTEGETKREARKDGWLFKGVSTVYCKQCKKEIVK